MTASPISNSCNVVAACLRILTSLLFLITYLLAIFASPMAASAEGTFISAPSRVDMVYDDAREILYITNGGSVLRYQMSTNSFLDPFELGGNLKGIDISPDGNTLIVADNSYTLSNTWIYEIDLVSGANKKVNFPRSSGEGGTFAVAFGNDGKVLATHSDGSFVPLRRYDPVSGTMSVLASVRHRTMLRASADGSVIAFAESDISDGRWGSYRVSDGSIIRKQGYSDGTSWFNYEIAINHDATQYAIPTYGGTFIADADLVKNPDLIGGYTTQHPIGVAYSPTQDIVYFPWSGTNKVYAYDTNTLTKIAEYDFENAFNHHGNYAFVKGRLKTSSDGNLLFATVDGGVRYVNVQGGSAPDLVVESVTPSKIDVETGETITIDVVIKNQGNKVSDTFWAEFYDNPDPEPPRPFQDGVKWHEFGPLSPGQSAAWQVTLKWSKPGLQKLYVQADSYKDVSESNETNNIAGPVNINVTGETKLADLVIESVTPAKIDPVTGETITVAVVLKNQGLDSAENFFVQLYSNPIPEPPELFQEGEEGEFISSLGAGESITRTINMNWKSPGIKKIWAQVDSYDNIDESNELNNVNGPVEVSVTGEPLYPDLIVESVTPSKTDPVTNETINVSVVVKNQGNDAAEGFYIELYDNPSPEPPEAYQDGDWYKTVNSLAPGESTTWTISTKWLKPGNHKFWAQVDSYQQVEETNESNNILGPVTLTVTGVATMPDLIIESITPSIENPIPGQNLIIDIVVKNQGTVAAEDFNVELYSNPSPEPPQLYQDGALSKGISSLAAGASTIWKISAKYNSTGIRKLWAQVDNYDEVDEAYEDNNIAGPVLVTVVPNQPPVLSPIGNKTFYTGLTASFSIMATDPNGTPLTYSATGLPSGASFDSSTKTFSWMPAAEQVGPHIITFSASDGSLKASEQVTITVQTDTINPVGEVKINANAQFTKSAAVNLTLSAIDNESGISKMQIKNDNGEWSEWQNYSSKASWRLSPGDGVKQVSVRYMDRSGNESIVASDSIFLDTTLPKVMLNLEPWSTNISKSASFPVSWSGEDKSSSGVASYNVKYKIGNDSTWQDWKSGTAVKATFSGLPGLTYSFRAVATDRAGNISKPVIKKITVPYNEASLIKKQSGFNNIGSGTSFYLGTVKYSTVEDQSILYKFTGKKVALITTKGPNRSKAKIYIDGQLIKTIDSYAPALAYRQVIFSKSWSTSGAHTIKIVNVATPGRKRFDIDAIGIEH